MRPVRRSPRGETGTALIATVLVIFVVTALAGVAAQDALHGISSSSVSAKLMQASGAAEAGIDATIAEIQTGAGLPDCGPQGEQQLGPPANSAYTVTITYYDDSGASLCPKDGVEPSSSPTSAVLSSVGTTNATGTFGDATWQALLKLTPSPSTASGFDQALYSNTSISFTDKGVVYGDGAGNDADIYSSGDFVCTNTEFNYGNLYVQGDISAKNQCGSAGSWWAGGSICDSGKGTVSGSVTAGGDVTGVCNTTPGTISMGTSVVGQGAVARAAISPWPCPNSQIQGSCTAYTGSSTNPGPPPPDPFPLWDLIPSTWQSAGYTVINDTTGTSSPATPCPSTAQVYKDLTNMSGAGSPPTVIYTDCQISWNVSSCPKVGNTCTWSFANNLAVVDTGGYTASGSVSFQSTSSTSHSFFMMVPYDMYNSATVNQCGSGSGNGTGTVNFTNAITSGGAGNANPLGVMIYSPCSMTFTNSITMTGQIYAGGSVSITNAYTMHFQLVPVPGFSTSSSVTPAATTYTVALLYERQD